MLAAASSNHTAVGFVLLMLLLSFLFGLGWLLVRLVSNVRKDGSGATSGCLLATGFGCLSVILAGVALAGVVTLAALAVGPSTLRDFEDRWIQRRSSARALEQRRDDEARRAESAPGQPDEESQAVTDLHEELDDAVQAAHEAYEEALDSAREAGAEVEVELRNALREAAQALREARAAARDARREAATALGEAATAAGEALNDASLPPNAVAPAPLALRFDVRGAPGPELSALVERISGEPVRLSIVRPAAEQQESQWIYSLTRRAPEEVSRLEDAIRAALAEQSFPDDSRVEFRDVVLQDEQRHAPR